MTKILVTGFTGCIGAATVEYLLGQGIERLVGFSRSANMARIQKSFRSRISTVQGDIASWENVRELICTEKPTHIVHLSAFQTPDCQSQPFRGMEINVGGTSNLFRAAAEVGTVQRVVFASSAAVYGPRSIYEGTTVSEEVPFKPSHLYGYWKLCGEGIAQAFHKETQIPTVCLRIATTYGPGRDQGMTSAPTTAIKAVVLDVPFEIPYAGGEHYHYVHDVACGFGQATLAPYEGYGVFNTRGITSSSHQFLELLKTKSQAQGLGASYRVKVADKPLSFPFACDLDDTASVEIFPQMTLTPLEEGISESLTYFRRLADQGKLRSDSISC